MHGYIKIFRNLRTGTAVIAATFVIVSTALAQSVPIESDAVMSNDLPRSIIDPGVGMIRAHGWKCDSISALRPFLMSRGFVLVCNRFSYTYNFEDKGGNWVVSLD